MEDICTIALDTKPKESNIKSAPSFSSFLGNKVRLLDSRQSTCCIDVNSNNDQVPTIDNHDTLYSLFLIVKSILSYQVTSDKIKQLQSIIVNYQNNKIKNEFISTLCKELDKKQLHKLNCVIMQTMNELLPEEDEVFYLRSSDDKVWRQLLLEEAKRCGITIELPSSEHYKELSMPKIPTEILQLYKILMNTFYNQENRKSDKHVDEKVAESIHWLFINPLITENEQMYSSLYIDLLKVPGKYTELLIKNNIFDQIIYQVIKDDSVLPTANTTKQLNNIMGVFKVSIIDILIDKVQEATKQLNTVIDHNIIVDVIQPDLERKIIEDLLDNRQQIINDRISLLQTLSSQDQSAIMNKLLLLVHTNTANEQVKCNSYPNTVYLTSFLPLIYEDKDLFMYDHNQDIDTMCLAGEIYV